MLNNYSAAVDCFARALAFVVNVVGIVRTWPTRNPALPILEVLRGAGLPLRAVGLNGNSCYFFPRTDPLIFLRVVSPVWRTGIAVSTSECGRGMT